MKNASVIVAYSLVFAIMAVSTWVGLELASAKIGDAYLALAPAMAISCLFRRFGPALFGILLMGLSAWYFFTPPVWSFALPAYPHDVTLLLFLVVMGFISALLIWQKFRAKNALKAEEDFFLSLMRGPRS